MKSARAKGQWVRTAIEDRSMVRYAMVSVVAVVVSQVVLFGAQFFWSARVSNVVAVFVSAVPSYQLNRRWVWGKSGRSGLVGEIIPFWAMALAGLLLSTWGADYAAANASRITASSVGQKLVVNFAAFAAFGVMWVAKYAILNRVLFAPGPTPAEVAD